MGLFCGRGRIGRRACLRCMYPEGCGGSSPLDRTTDRISILHRKHQGWRPTAWSEGQLSKAGHPVPYHCGLTAWPSRSSRTTISQLDLFVRLLFGALGSQIASTAASSLTKLDARSRISISSCFDRSDSRSKSNGANVFGRQKDCQANVCCRATDSEESLKRV